MTPEIRSLRHRRVTMDLRRFRKEAGLTREQVAGHLEWAGSKVTRVETGDWKRLHPHDVVRMMALYGLDEQGQEFYADMVRRERKRPWWADYADVAADYTAFEDEAAAIQTFEPQFVPGLLQTEGYARALIRANPVVEDEEVERRVEVRMERQRQLMLGHDGPQFRGIIDESVIHRPVGGNKVMADQLQRLIDAASGAQRVNVQILPLSAGAHPGMDGSFVILRYAESYEQPIVYLENAEGGQYPRGDEAIERYSLMFEHLVAMSLSPRDSIELMRGVMGRLCD